MQIWWFILYPCSCSCHVSIFYHISFFIIASAARELKHLLFLQLVEQLIFALDKVAQRLSDTVHPSLLTHSSI